MHDERHYLMGAILSLLEGSSNRWDWKAFTSRPLRDVELDRIRQCAAEVDLPLDAEGQAILLDLLDQAELAGPVDPAKPKPWRIDVGMLVGLAVGAVLWWAKYLPGAGPFSNLHLLLMPAAAGILCVMWRNSRKQVGIYERRIVEQNKRGRV